jgi:GH24 family phage-related lysozyme (muramidase)
MQTSEAGIRFIKSFEGFSEYPYKDDGYWAWGYGHDQQGTEPVPPQISQEQADALLRQDLASRYEPVVNALVPPYCTQNQFDSCCDFAYNLGGSSLRMMLSHGWKNVPEQMLRWDHVGGKVSPGLTARRQEEVKLFNS